MEIKGINKLKKNNYKSIRISENKITITGNNESTIEDISIFDDIKDLSEEELTNLICFYYSKYHNINYINENLNYKNNPLGEVRSLDDTKLTYKRPLYKESANILFNNYMFNRKYFILNNNVPSISIYLLKKESSYRKINNNINLTLNIDEAGRLSDYELEFLNWLLNTIFEDELINISYDDKTIWRNINFESNYHKISFCTLFLHDERVLNILKELITTHNEKIEKNKIKVLQMKMED